MSHLNAIAHFPNVPDPSYLSAIKALDGIKQNKDVLYINGVPLSAIHLRKEVQKTVPRSRRKRQHTSYPSARGDSKRIYREATNIVVMAQQRIEHAFKTQRNMSWRKVETELWLRGWGFRQLDLLAGALGVVFNEVAA